MKKLIKVGSLIFIGAIILNILETAYFGWNQTAMSRQEECWDVVCQLLVNTGVGLMIVGYVIDKDK
jgi:uncharacterized membrane protein YidH (DUF202 family)